MSGLMISVSGIRGIVDESFTPDVVRRYVAAFAATRGEGPIVVGRDSRPSGPQFREVIVETLLALGRDVVELGIVPTPTVQLMVEQEHAAGGIALTASHNPVQWNALKFVGSNGRFLTKTEGQPMLALAEQDAEVVAEKRGTVRQLTDAVDRHVAAVLALSLLNVTAIRSKHFVVVVDALHGAAGSIARTLLEALGCTVEVLGEEPSGNFSRPPEPLPKNITGLCERVRASSAVCGFALDPDGDRLALVDEHGEPLGEDLTLALASQEVTSAQPGTIVTNLSTSAKVDAVANITHSKIERTPVGEANVVEGIVTHHAVIGGEGNGGVILPQLHLGRDAAAGMALVLALLARTHQTLSQLAGALPTLAMAKERVESATPPNLDAVAAVLEKILPGATLDRRDGLRVTKNWEWVHVRPSGTEPIIRIYSEAQTQDRAAELADAARKAIESST